MAEGRPFVLAPGGGAVSRLFDATPLPPEAHAGLVFERYLPIWEGSPVEPRRTELRAPLESFVRAYNGRGQQTEAVALLRALHLRQGRAVRAMRQVETREFSVAWRLCTGLGGEHATENGFTFDAVVGVPVLPGSSIKGLCRQAAQHEPGVDVDRLFGPARAEGDETSAQGDLIFFDAYPREWPQLGVDVVNCHHPAYYTQGGAAPRETENPVPVFFLTVMAGTRFVFHVRSQSGQHARKALDLLARGLDLLGIGAKTAAGYGQMHARP
jgi:CRISPR-associated protein Cmr6